MRASKLPYRNFENNIRRAEALARLDGYLEDLINNEGKGTISSFTEIVDEFKQVFGINRIIQRIADKIKKEFEVEMQLQRKENIEKAGKEFVMRITPKLHKIKIMFEDLGLLMDQTLLEQALIAAVSAFEVYIRDIAVSIVKLNLKVRKRFTFEINKELDSQKLEQYGQDSRRVQGEIVASLIKLDVNNIRSIFNRLIGVQNLFVDKKTERKVSRIFERRHLIIHRAGISDPKYKRITKSRKSIDTRIILSRRIVLNSIKTLINIVQEIENSIN